VEECVAAGCEEVTVWGLDDSATWLDTFLGRPDTRPLLFDADLAPKPAHAAVRDALLTG
jgi:GH35 family endo-1,4-beta-xylanase